MAEQRQGLLTSFLPINDIKAEFLLSAVLYLALYTNAEAAITQHDELGRDVNDLAERRSVFIA